MTTSYNAKDVMVMFGALPIVGEASDGDFVTVTPLGDGTKVEVGARGHAVVIDDNNEACKVTVRVAANGAGRNVLAALVTHWNVGNMFFPIGVVSKSTGESIAGGAAKLEKLPVAAFGSGAPNREISFVVPRYKMVVTPEV